MLTFVSPGVAKTAAAQLPDLLRAHLQKHSAYSIRTHVMAVLTGKDMVRDAAERRKRPRNDAGPARASANMSPGLGGAAGPPPPPMQPSRGGGGLPMWHESPPMMYVQRPPPQALGAQRPMHMVAPSMHAQPPAQPQVPALPAGFLHPVGAPGGTTSAWQGGPAPGGPATELGPASTPPEATQRDAHARAPESTGVDAVQGGGLAGLGVDLAAILSSATGGASSARQDDDASNMLSLLQQLGSTAPSRS